MKRICNVAFVILSFIAVSSVALADAEVGQIIGTVFDAKNGEPLIGASVQLEGTTIGAACDIDGRFVIRNVPRGTHTVLIASVGYAPKRITEVAVTNGDPVTVDATLTEAVTELKPVEVTAERAKATEAVSLIRRRAAVNVTDAMSAEMIKKSGDANAGEALKRVVGVSIVDGRSLVVRGMGGRYSGVVLNGAPLPSPEPEKREVPLDMFPAGLLDDVTATKTFTPDKPGTFSGGLVDLATKEFPSRLSYNVAVGQSYNSESTGKNMLYYPGGSLDWLGFDDGTRKLPDAVAVGGWGLSYSDTTSFARNEKAAESLSDVWTPQVRRARPNVSFAGSLGNTYLIGQNSKLGIIGSLNYSDSYKVRHDIYRYPSAYDYSIDRGIQSILWGSLVNVTYAAGDRHKVSVKGLYNRTADDEAFTSFGIYSGSSYDFSGEDRLRFAARNLATIQLSGEHKLGFPFASTVDWRVQRAQALQNEPDTRSNRWDYIYATEDSLYKFLEPNHYSGVHIYQNVNDDEAHASMDWTIPVSSGVKLKTGLLFENRTRLQTVSRYRLFSQGQAVQSPSGEVIFAPQNVGPGRNQYFLEDLNFPDDPYDATEHTFANYAQVQADLFTQLRFVGGARREAYTLGLHTGDRTIVGGRINVVRDQEDWMPMASLTYSFADNSALHGIVLRGVVSQTLSRPEFREMAPFYYQDLASGRPTYGNGTLIPCKIVNYDFRTEFFPSPGEVFAVSIFAKHFDHPIEQVVLGAAQTTPQNSFANQQEAKTYGFEIEGRRGLSFLGGKLSNFWLGGNVTRAFGEVTVAQNDLKNPTEKRPLEGQSAWSGNAFLSYSSPNGGTDVQLNYNAFSRRLRIADVSSKEDWYEEPQHMLDLVVSHKLRWDFAMKIQIKNILRADYALTQEQTDGNFAGTKQVLEQHNIGQTYSVTFSYGL